MLASELFQQPDGSTTPPTRLCRAPPSSTRRRSVGVSTENTSTTTDPKKTSTNHHNQPPQQTTSTKRSQGLAFQDEKAVNWCAGLGTVLANEEIIDGTSERGGFPVERCHPCNHTPVSTPLYPHPVFTPRLHTPFYTHVFTAADSLLRGATRHTHSSIPSHTLTPIPAHPHTHACQRGDHWRQVRARRIPRREVSCYRR